MESACRLHLVSCAEHRASGCLSHIPGPLDRLVDNERAHTTTTGNGPGLLIGHDGARHGHTRDREVHITLEPQDAAGQAVPEILQFELGHPEELRILDGLQQHARRGLHLAPQVREIDELHPVHGRVHILPYTGGRCQRNALLAHELHCLAVESEADGHVVLPCAFGGRYGVHVPDLVRVDLLQVVVKLVGVGRQQVVLVVVGGPIGIVVSAVGEAGHLVDLAGQIETDEQPEVDLLFVGDQLPEVLALTGMSEEEVVDAGQALEVRTIGQEHHVVLRRVGLHRLGHFQKRRHARRVFRPWRHSGNDGDGIVE